MIAIHRFKFDSATIFFVFLFPSLTSTPFTSFVSDQGRSIGRVGFSSYSTSTIALFQSIIYYEISLEKKMFHTNRFDSITTDSNEQDLVALTNEARSIILNKSIIDTNIIRYALHRQTRNVRSQVRSVQDHGIKILLNTILKI